MTSKRIQGITIEIAGDATKLNNSLKSVDKQLSQTQASLKDINKLMAFDKSKLGAGNVELLTQKQKYLTSEIALTKDRLKELEAAQGQVARDSKEWDDLQREIIATKQNLQSLEDEYREFGSVSSQQLKLAGEHMKDVGDKISDVGKGLTTYVTGPIVAAGAASVKAFNEVDNALDTVTKKTGATGDELEKMHDMVKDIAETIPTSFSAAAEAVGEVNTRFGLTGDELQALSEQFVKFAALNETDVSDSIDSVQKALSAYGLGAEDAAKLLDRMNKVGQQTGVEVSKLSDGIVSNSTAFQEMGLNIDEAVVFMGQLEKSGTNSETVLNGMRKALKNATKDGKPLNEALAELQDTIANGTDSMDGLTAAYDIFGKSGDQIYGAIKNGTLDFNDLASAAESAAGSVSDTFEETLDPIDQMATTLNALKDLGAEIVTTAGPMLIQIMQGLSDAVKAVKETWDGLDEDQQQMIIKAAAIAAAVGPVLMVVGKITSMGGGLLQLLGKITPLMGGLSGSIGGVGASLSAMVGPAAAIVGIGAAIAGSIAYLYTTNEDFRKSMNTTAATLKETFLKSMDEAKPAIEGLKQAFQSFMNFIEPILSYIMTAWAATVNGIVSALPPIINAISSAISTLVNIWQAFAALFRGDFDGFKEHINTTISSGIEFAKSIINAGLNYIKGFFSAFGVDIVGSIKSAFTRMADTVRSKTNEVKTNIANGLNAAADFVRSLPSKFYQWGADMIQNLINGISQKIGVLKQKVSDVANTIRSYIHFSEPDVGPLSDASEYMPDFINMLVKGLDQGIPKVESAADRLASAMAMGGNNSQTFNAGGVTVNVYATEGQQANDIVDVIEQRINRNITQQQAVWGMA